MKNICLLFLSITLCNSNIYAQDLLLLKGRTRPLKGKFIDANISSIFFDYKPLNSDTIKRYEIDPKQVISIHIFNGPYLFVNPKNNYELYDINKQRKNAIKLHPLSLYTNSLSLSYERSLSPVFALECGFIYINHTDREAQGLQGKIGLKLKTNISKYVEKGYYAHRMEGLYFKPEYIHGKFSITTVDAGPYPTVYTDHVVVNRAMIFNFGSQWVFNDRILIDISAGFGIAMNLNPFLKLAHQYAYLKFYPPSNTVLSVNLKIGVIL